MELIFTHYLSELVAVISITVLAIISPGPDFIVVVRNSLTYSCRSGVFTALGVALAIWVHVFYTLAGIGLVLSKSIVLFSIVKYLGAAYLIYLGVSCLRSSGNISEVAGEKSKAVISDGKSFQTGFLNNVLNPKATLFFVSLFTQLVSVNTPLAIQVTYGAIISISAFIWFSSLAVFLNRSGIKAVFYRIQKVVEKVMGAVLVGFGLKVALSSTN